MVWWYKELGHHCPAVVFVTVAFQWLSARLWYLQCIRNGDTAVWLYHQFDLDNKHVFLNSKLIPTFVSGKELWFMSSLLCLKLIIYFLQTIRCQALGGSFDLRAPFMPQNNHLLSANNEMPSEWNCLAQNEPFIVFITLDCHGNVIKSSFSSFYLTVLLCPNLNAPSLRISFSSFKVKSFWLVSWQSYLYDGNPIPIRQSLYWNENMDSAHKNHLWLHWEPSVSLCRLSFPQSFSAPRLCNF